MPSALPFPLRAFLGLRGGLHRLGNRLAPPELSVFEHVMGVAKTMMLATAVRLQLPDRLAEQPCTPEALGAALKVNTDALARLLRALAAIGVVDARPDGTFAANRLTRTLLPNAAMSHFATYFGSRSNVLAWADFEQTVRSGDSAFERVHGLDLWQYLAAHPDEGRVFDEAMTTLTLAEAPRIAAAYPWGRFRKVCDVGGGRGALLTAILKMYPHVQGMLFDDPRILRQAALTDRDVAARVELRAGSFFQEVPAGADAYVLKDILHDWDDARAGQILNNVRRAMKPGLHLLLVEMPAEPDAAELPSALVDLHMMTVCRNGRQRSQGELRALLERSGFGAEHVVRMHSPIALFSAVSV